MFTVEGFRDKLRTGKPADGETTTQFAVRLSHYFDRWTELSEIAQEYDALRELLIKEQFLMTTGFAVAVGDPSLLLVASSVFGKPENFACRPKSTRRLPPGIAHPAAEV
ncbi:hypothetical protein HPB49_000117 [Dermacentor silvarum]|uniref:Uncharacterized protein n=1 Tax=Dermacentor silvarum TaxID=543639 RepID=A0ACB8D1K5_DERSI|nr:hypothetical protein HPB49_000117 [Dermacentor silvarum]